MNELLSGLAYITDDKTFAFSAENPTGARGGGSHGAPNEKLSPCLFLQPGETITLAETDGPGAIQSMWFGGYVGWEFILRIYWDNQENPNVESPLGAFFGYGFADCCTDKNGDFPTLNSAAVLVAPCRGMNCYWPMPFLKHCKITLQNISPKNAHNVYYIITGAKKEVRENCAYFHASYRQMKPIAYGSEYTVIDGIKGKGHYAGTALFVTLNGSNGCWVEGEAKMFLDGDTYPSVNYTGTEDYFCGSYNFGKDMRQLNKYQTYSGAYAGMYAVMGECPNENDWESGMRYSIQPRFMLYRWHIPDPIHFERDFKMTLQSLGNFAYGYQCRRDDYASVAYWYQTLPSSPLAPLPALDMLDMQ